MQDFCAFKRRFFIVQQQGMAARCVNLFVNMVHFPAVQPCSIVLLVSIE